MFKLSTRLGRHLLKWNPPLFNQLMFLKTDYESDPSERKLDYSKLNPDNFGNVNNLSKCANISEDPDGYEKLEIKRGIKISLPAYERILDELYRQRPRDVNKLLETYRQMIYHDRYKPSSHVYTMLITACAQIGYTKKAFELFEEMKRYKLKPTRAAVTSLFNSCANCTADKQYGLQEALALREYLESNGYCFNTTQYNSMIKTFALLNDMKNVDATIQEMKKKRYGVNLDTYSMLIMGCINDHNNGLFTAISIMRNVFKSNSKLNVSIFNLFLRCIRDCGIQNEQDLLKHCGPLPKKINTSKLAGHNQCEEEKQQQQQQKQENELINHDSNNHRLPNLLTGENINQIISIDFESLSLPRNRFLLFGGLNGFLKIMNSFDVKPNLKTITLMIDLIDDENCFEEILKIITANNIKPDVCLYNVFIKKFAVTKQYSICKKMIQHMQENNMRPDIMTFGAIALSCRNKKDARKFLKEMNECNIIPNIQITGSLINSACHYKDLDYLGFILKYIDQNNLKMSNIDIEKVALFLDEIRKIVIDSDRNTKNIAAPNSQTINTELYDEFSSYFKQLIKRIRIEINPNAWSQFEQNEYKSPKEQYHSVIGYLKKINETKFGQSNIKMANVPDDED